MKTAAIEIVPATDEQKKELFTAAATKNDAKVKEIINQGVSPDFTVDVSVVENFPLFRSQIKPPLFAYVKPESKNWTLVFTAVASDNPSLLKFLIEKRAPLNVTGPEGETLLGTAVAHKNKENIKLILDNSSTDDIGVDNLKKYLAGAFSANNIELAKSLHEYAVKKDIDISDTMPDLEKAIKQKNTTFIDFVLNNKKDLDLNVPFASGAYPLLLAIHTNSADLVKEFAFKGADVNVVDANGRNGLFYCAKKADGIEMATFLLDSGTRINELDKKSTSPLMNALFVKDDALAALYVSRGADVTAKNKDNYSVLHFAARNGNKNLVADILKGGAVVNAVGPNGYTPLMLAAERGNNPVCRLLVQYKASDKYKNKEGFKASDLAVQRGHAGLYDYILANAK
ncbi:ankyrin repeat protein [Elusimicrobium posterum]|uniref:ankyrin repeat domain-containing protein n=1 Tax=Elusimicrobium posterum TaxID=3116653 RepID=UPI003C760436